MKFNYTIISIILTGLFIISCGGDPEAEGDAFYEEHKFKNAISRYLQVKKTNKQNPKIDEKIALSYFSHGAGLFEKRKNVKAFSANFEKAKEFIPEGSTSESFNKAYSTLLFKLASAYYDTKAKNEIQKKQYFEYTLEYLDEALAMDMENSAAEDLLTKIKEENFQKMFDKGVSFYKKGKKEKKNHDFYLVAEYYLARAVSFNENNTEAANYLSKTRKKTLAIPDFDQRLPFVVFNKQYSGSSLFIDFRAVNNSNDPYEFDPDKLVLVDIDENEYAIDKEKTADFKEGLLNKVELKSGQELVGDIAFKVSKKIKIAYLMYNYSDDLTIKKYFP